jgi:hypothetical protein
VRAATDTAFQNCDCLDSITRTRILTAGGQVSLGKYEEDRNDRAHEQSRGVNFQCGHKTLRRPNPWKKGAEVRKFKDVVSSCGFLTPAEWRMCTDRALSSTRLWRDLVNAGELKIRKADGNFA